MNDAADIMGAVVHEVDAGRRAALCVVVARRGSAPQIPGAMLCIDEGGKITGTVGGGAGEAEIIQKARSLLIDSAEPEAHPADQKSPDRCAPAGAERGTAYADAATAAGRVFTVDLDCDYGFGDGPICGGQMDVAVMVFSGRGEVQSLRETLGRVSAGHPAVIPIRVDTSSGPAEYRLNIEAPPKLLIAGGGHIGLALAPLMVRLGFRVTVVDDRSEFSGSDRFPPPIEPVTGDIAQTLREWPIDASTYVVIVTRGHKHDEQALAAVIRSPARYLGMIGSRRKIAVVFDNLRQQGATQVELDRVHSPIGLDIKAVTPEEIAVSIAAELISVRRADYRKAVEGPFRADVQGNPSAHCS